MVSTGYATARNNVHHYQTPGLGQQAQYLKETYGLAPSTPPVQLPNDSEWPSLNNALLFGASEQDRAQQRNLGRRPVNQLPPNQQLHRRPASIGRSGLQQQEAARVLGAQQQLNAQMQQQKQMQQTGNGIKNPKLYKTEVCRNFADTGSCRYADKCQYAHGDADKRPIPRHPKYKTEICRSYVNKGLCLYGLRCHFIHNEEPHVLAKMIADNAAATAPNHSQMQQPPIRPNNLFSGGACSSPTIGSQSQHGTPVNMTPSGNNTTIARVASLAASAYNQNPSYFNHQFQTQLQIFNDGLKTPLQGTPTQASGHAEISSNGDSPIPSSNDSGTESPVCSFSPELDDPSMLFMRMQLESNKSVTPKLQQPSAAPLNLLPSSLNDAESGFSSSSSTSSNVGTKSSLNSPVIGSPPHVATAPNTMWSNGTVGTPTSAARLPVFERLSNGP